MYSLDGCHLCCKCVLLWLLILCLVRKGDNNLDECCSYLTQASKQPEQIRKGAEACCPYLAGGFNQFNLETLKQSCAYFKLRGNNISEMISSNEPKILLTNRISSSANKHHSFFCYSKVNPDHLEFSTLDGKSYKELNDSWKNVYTYQLSCGILLTFSPIESCQYNAAFKCVAKSNDTHQPMKQARINVLSFKILNFNQSYDSVQKRTAKNITCKLEIAVQQVAVPSLEIVFQRYNKVSGEYISIKSSETFLLNPTESQIKINEQIITVYLQRSLTVLCSRCDKDALVCVLLDKACGVVKHFLLDAVIPFNGNTDIATLKLSRGVIASIFIVICLAVLSFLFTSIHLRRYLRSQGLFNTCTYCHKKSSLVLFNPNVEELLKKGEWELQNSNKEPPIYDVFISYSYKNREWVKNSLLCELERRDVKTCIDYRDFVPGKYITKNILDAIHNSRKTIVVLSRDYFKSEYCKGELQTALKDQQIISISLDDCEIPDSLKEKALKWESNDNFWSNLFVAILS